MNTALIFVCSQNIDAYINAAAYLQDKREVTKFTFVFLVDAPTESPATHFVEEILSRLSMLAEGKYNGRPIDIDDSANVTEEAILLDETRRILDEGIAKLPPQQQRVYQLCHQCGLKYEEAAEQLNLSPQTVHRHMKLALRFLRKYLQNHADLAVIFAIFQLTIELR